MKRIAVILGFLAMTTALHAQAPVASAVVNAASYTLSALPNGGIAEGAMFIVFGTNMGPATLQQVQSFPLQTTLAGTSVSATVGGTTTHAYMIYSAAGQVAAILPSSTPVGSGSLVVTYNGQSSAPLPFQVVQSNFGAFTWNNGGSGTAIILDGNGNKITSLNPAAPNQTVALWGTGLGPITADESEPPPQVNMTNIPVVVYVGTAQATVVYRGRSGGSAGIDQINFQIPPGQLGCNVSVIVQINSVVSNVSTIAVSNGGPCSDGNGISSSTLNQLVSSGTSTLGYIELTRQTLQFNVPGLGSQNLVTESGGADFDRFGSTAYFQNGSLFNQISVGGCSVITFQGSQTATPTFPTFTGLDAGSSIGVSGPNGTKNLTEQQKGSYSATFSSQTPGLPFSPFLGQGTYIINGTGGADVGSFQATIAGVASLNSNVSNITGVPRNQPLNITWQGGPGSGYVQILGFSTSGSGSSAVGAIFTCVAPASAGQFTVPSAVLLALPPSAVVQGAPLGFLYVGSQINGSFSAPGIQQGITEYSDSIGVNVAYN